MGEDKLKIGWKISFITLLQNLPLTWRIHFSLVSKEKEIKVKASKRKALETEFAFFRQLEYLGSFSKMV